MMKNMVTVEIHLENMKVALEECMKECGVSRYEAAYMMAFEFYECAGFDTEVLEKELKSMSEETLIHHILTEM